MGVSFQVHPKKISRNRMLNRIRVRAFLGVEIDNDQDNARTENKSKHLFHFKKIRGHANCTTLAGLGVPI